MGVWSEPPARLKHAVLQRFSALLLRKEKHVHNSSLFPNPLPAELSPTDHPTVQHLSALVLTRWLFAAFLVCAQFKLTRIMITYQVVRRALRSEPFSVAL